MIKKQSFVNKDCSSTLCLYNDSHTQVTNYKIGLLLLLLVDLLESHMACRYTGMRKRFLIRFNISRIYMLCAFSYILSHSCRFPYRLWRIRWVCLGAILLFYRSLPLPYLPGSMAFIPLFVVHLLHWRWFKKRCRIESFCAWASVLISEWKRWNVTIGLCARFDFWSRNESTFLLNRR